MSEIKKEESIKCEICHCDTKGFTLNLCEKCFGKKIDRYYSDENY